MNTKLFSGEPLPQQPPESNPDRASFDRKLLDYLRRLTAKIAQATGGIVDATFWTKNDETSNIPSSRMVIAGSGITLDYSTPGQVTVTSTGGGYAESFVSKLDTDASIIYTDGAANPISFNVDWNAGLHFNTSEFLHDNTTSPSEITLVHGGVYQFQFDVSHNCEKASLDFWVEVKVSGAWYRAKYSILRTSIETFPPFVTFNLSVGIPIIAGTTCRIRGMVGTIGGIGPNNSCSLFAISTRLSIIRIGSQTNGGTGGGLGWDASPPTWTEAAP